MGRYVFRLAIRWVVICWLFILVACIWLQTYKTPDMQLYYFQDQGIYEFSLVDHAHQIQYGWMFDPCVDNYPAETLNLIRWDTIVNWDYDDSYQDVGTC